MTEVLEVENLKAHYFTEKGVVKAVDGVSFSLRKGESLGIAGESGCGKSTLGFSILRLIPPPGRIVEGRIYLNGEDIMKLGDEALRQVRWAKIAMVFQGAMNSLNPVYTVRRQMVETIRAHRPETGEKEAESMALRSLEMVGLHRQVLRRYPHELSGGMKQRVVTAMALMLEPEVLIADEPTTALDVVVQAQITNLLKDLQKKLGMSLILITHDLSLIPELSDYVTVMYAGTFIEYGPLQEIYRRPRHPYTHLLLDSIPRLTGKKKLSYIPGTPPDLTKMPSGCRFHPRCPYVIQKCIDQFPELTDGADHKAACHRMGEEL